jgi:hypothetical protein
LSGKRKPEKRKQNVRFQTLGGGVSGAAIQEAINITGTIGPASDFTEGSARPLDETGAIASAHAAIVGQRSEFVLFAGSVDPCPPCIMPAISIELAELALADAHLDRPVRAVR